MPYREIHRNSTGAGIAIFRMSKLILSLVLVIAALSSCQPATPENEGPRFYLDALKQYNSGRIDEAVALMEKYANAHPDLALPAYWLGVMEMDLDNMAEARRRLEDAIEIAPAFHPALERLGYLEMSVGHYEKAVGIYERLSELRPGSADVVYRLGLNELFNFNNEAAVSHLSRALDINPRHVPAAMMAMFPLQYLDNLEGSEKALELAVAARPDSAVLLMLMARNKQLLGKLDESEALYLKVMKMDPEYSKAPMELAGRIYIPEGRNAEAEVMLKKAISLEPSRNSNRIELGFLYYTEGKLDEAWTSFEEALRREPLNYQALFGMAKVQAARGNRDMARHFIERTLELEPNHERAKMMLSIMDGVKPGGDK